MVSLSLPPSTTKLMGVVENDVGARVHAKHVTSWLSTLPTTYPLKIGACDLIFVCVFQLVTFPRSFQNKVLPPRETQLGSDDKPNWLVERL